MQSTESQIRFVEMIELHKGIVYKVAHAYCHDPDEQKDLVQEIILQLWRSFESYDDSYKASTWMYRVALNVAVSNLRKSKVREKHHTPINDNLLEVVEEDEADLSEELILLRRFIQEQNKIDKALLLLYLDEKSHTEIAEMIGISVSNVGTKLGRIKNKLRKYLTEKLEHKQV